MKNLYPNPSISAKAAKILFVAFFTLVIARINVFAQPELNFKNASLYSGTAGTDGAVYKFPSVSGAQDALVTIVGRSSSLVTLSSIDLTSTGYDKAFQPQINYNNGHTNGATTWWMEFMVTFVTKNTTTPATISSFNVSAIDIDGDNGFLHEWDAFYGPVSYTLEQNSILHSSNLVVNGSNAGKSFIGDINDHSGIDTSDTRIMATLLYNNVSSIKVRFGGTTTGSSSNTDRMYSTYFKNFNYIAPLVFLPIKLLSFNAMLNNNKVDLKWTTASEENVSRFVIERSFDGTHFSDAAIVFAAGNTTEKMDYNYSDNISSISSKVIYYRLRSVDNDGKTQYSEVRIIRIFDQTAKNISITTYPNPVINQLNITIPNNWQSKNVAIEIFNANGQVAAKSENSNGSQTETINVSSLAPGFYVVKASCNGETAQQKVIKR